jgi:hypothetical protein
MKTTYIRIYLLVMVCSLKTITCFAQPIIKVPRYCEVVLAGIGTGTATGFGGTVGDGGIVVMPDPFDYHGEEGNFYSSLDEFELINWELLGDLSLQTETSYNQAIQFVAGANPVNIQSYNKKLRFGEMPSVSLPNLDTRWARSKGRIVVTYYDRRCINKITFDVYKRYKSDRKKNLVPPIDGADCVLPNTVYTFSADPIASDNPNDEIGFDKYYWSGLPENCTLLYTAADNSSITFKTGENVPSFTLQCCYGRANDWDGETTSALHTTCATKQVGGQATTPSYVTAPPTCHPIGQPSFNIVYNNPPLGTTYNWTSLNPDCIISTSNTSTVSTITVTTPNNNPGFLVLTITNGSCPPVNFSYQINRSFALPLAITPTGATTTCINGTSTNNTFTLNPSLGANSVVWSIQNPSSLSGITLQNTNTSTVTVNTSSTAAGFFTLVATSGIAGCNTTNVSIPINIQPVAPAFTASSPSCVVRSTTGVTTVGVTPVAGATSYSWNTVPANAPGISITNGTTANPTIVFNSSVGVNSVILSVRANGVHGCNSATTTRTINYISVATNFTGGTFNDQYSVSGTCGAVTSWSLSSASGVTTYTASSGNVTITGINNNNLLISGTGGLVLTSVCANLASGITVCANLTGATNTQRLVTPGIKGVILSPNPNSGTFFITLESLKTEASATLYNLSGKEINSYPLKKGENKIENENLATGTYIVKLVVDVENESKLIMVK